MKVLWAELDAHVFWAVRDDDPAYVPVPCLEGWSLLNPALFEGAVGDVPAEVPFKTWPTFVREDGTFHYCSTGFALRPSAGLALPEWEPTVATRWDQKLFAFVRLLRSVSKQASLVPRLKSFGLADATPGESWSRPEKGIPCATASWPLRTSLRREHVVRAGALSLDTEPASYDTLLLDAINALRTPDYKTAFLFSVASMDHLSRMYVAKAANSALEDRDEEKLKAAFPNIRREALALTAATVDEQLRRAKFQDLTHRISQELTGRSLCKDDRGLHDAAIRLYKLRNKLMHSSLPFQEISSQLSGLDEAVEATNCAIRIVQWYGEPGGYAHPFDDAGMAFDCYAVKK